MDIMVIAVIHLRSVIFPIKNVNCLKSLKIVILGIEQAVAGNHIGDIGLRYKITANRSGMVSYENLQVMVLVKKCTKILLFLIMEVREMAFY